MQYVLDCFGVWKLCHQPDHQYQEQELKYGRNEEY